MDQFQKRQANREKRQESKQVVKNWDAAPKGKKKGGLKACPGYIDHTGRKKVELTVPCPTCKRHFCSQECLNSHTSICWAKKHLTDTKDDKPLLEICHQIFDNYYDENGHVLPKWVKEYKAESMTDIWRLRWDHPELSEACRLLKKHDPKFHAEIERRNGSRFFW